MVERERGPKTVMVGWALGRQEHGGDWGLVDAGGIGAEERVGGVLKAKRRRFVLRWGWTRTARRFMKRMIELGLWDHKMCRNVVEGRCRQPESKVSLLELSLQGQIEE